MLKNKVAKQVVKKVKATKKKATKKAKNHREEGRRESESCKKTSHQKINSYSKKTSRTYLKIPIPSIVRSGRHSREGGNPCFPVL